MHSERGRVRRVRDDREDVLQDLHVESLVETLRRLLVVLDILKEDVEYVEPSVADVAHRVLERPDDRVEHQLELVRRQAEQRREAVAVDGLQEQIEIGSVLWKLFEILADHVERALEHGVEDFGHVRRDVALELVDDRRHRAQHLRLARRRHTAPLVVEEHGVEQRGNEVVEHEFGVVGARHPVRNQLQSLLLDQAHALDQRLPRHVLAAQSDGAAYVLRHHLVHVQHVQVDATQLRYVRMAQSLARPHVRLRSITKIKR